MVHGMDVKARKAGLSLDFKPKNSLYVNHRGKNSTPDDGCSSVVEAIGNAMAFRKIVCESVEEILNFCRNSPSPSPKSESTNLRYVNELGSSLRVPAGGPISHMPLLRSPGLPYRNRPAEKSVQSTHFPFESRNQSTRSRTKRRTQRTNTTPVLGKAAKNCFLLGAFNSDYSVGSVTTSLLKDQDVGQGAMFMETHTVVLLGELSVGKSALCKTFFRSGMVTNNPRDHPSPCGPFEDDDDDDFMHPSIRVNDESEDTPRSDSHHIYERPITVNGECSRIRILDINAEKHRMECENYGDFEPYLETGDAYVITYAVTDRGTFKTVAEILSRMARHHPQRMALLPVILVGNKCDLVRRRQVTTTDGIRLAAKYNVKFIETSASLNQNVVKLFEGVVLQIRLRNLTKDSFAMEARPSARKGELKVSASDMAPHVLDTQSQGSSDSSSQPDSDTEDWSHGSRNSSFRRRNSVSRISTEGVTSSQASFDPSTSKSGSKEKLKYKKRASRCLMKILHRKNSSEKSRKCKSCQDLSIL